MKKRFLLIIGLLNALFPAQIVVESTGFKNREGQAIIVLYDSKETFPIIAEAFRKQIVAIQNKTIVVFDNIPAGIYSVAVYHDENNNGTLDMSWFPIPHPKEGMVLSNNAANKYLPPSFKKSSFEIADIATIRLKLKIIY